MKTATNIYAPDFLYQYISGTTFDLYSNCNSKFRELQKARERNDRESIQFWSLHINLISEIKNLLYKWFYTKESKIKNQNQFSRFIEVFKRYCEIVYKYKWAELITGKFTKESLTQ